MYGYSNNAFLVSSVSKSIAVKYLDIPAGTLRNCKKITLSPFLCITVADIYTKELSNFI